MWVETGLCPYIAIGYKYPNHTINLGLFNFSLLRVNWGVYIYYYGILILHLSVCYVCESGRSQEAI